jgi:hypothetical protein
LERDEKVFIIVKLSTGQGTEEIGNNVWKHYLSCPHNVCVHACMYIKVFAANTCAFKCACYSPI